MILKYNKYIFNYYKGVEFEVLAAVRTKMAVFWVVALCYLVEVYERFRDPCCLHHLGDSLSALMMKAAV
jgi:hypothetical protein